MQIFTKPILACHLLLLTCQIIYGQSNYPVTINTVIIPPVSANINQALNSGGRNINITVRNTQADRISVALFATLERITPGPFLIELRKDLVFLTLDLGGFEAQQLTSTQIQQAFGDFQVSNLEGPGDVLDDFQEGFNFKIPEGSYRLCLYARRIRITNNETVLLDRVTDPNAFTGCGVFTICKLAAPQFTQPVNNLSINSTVQVINPTTPVNFTWLPPQGTCGLPSGAFTYDLEIKEILDNQTITDAIDYNPYIFRKTTIPSSIFLLDTNLYRNILQHGKKYVIRVKANSFINDTASLENNGYSRVEAFQYGETIPEPALVNPPQFYYIPFNERKSNFWDDALTAYENKQRKDTLVPIREYISLVLARNGIVYSLDAIELLLAIHPEFQESGRIKLSQIPFLPVFPQVPETSRKSFDAEHTASLQPDLPESGKFKSYADSLLTLVQQRRATDTAMKMFETLLGPLSDFRQKATSADRISISNMNNMLAEILYVLRIYPSSFKSQYDQLRDLVSDLQTLMAPAFNGLSSLSPMSGKKTSLSSYKINALISEHQQSSFRPPGMDQALSFDIIVYHYSKEQPAAPVSTSADLVAAYKVFYVASSLYNHKNPEINVKTTKAPASTSQVTLPKIKYKFWTQNLFTQKMTRPQDVDLKEAFLKSGKNWPLPKSFSIVIKVD